MTRWTSLDIQFGDAAATTLVLVTQVGVIGTPPQGERTAAILKAASFEAKPGRWLDIVGSGVPSERVLALGVGDSDRQDRWREAGGNLIEAMQSLNLRAIRLPAAADLGIGVDLASILEGGLLHAFRLDQGRHEPNTEWRGGTLLMSEADVPLIATARQRADPVNRVRAWVEQPANLLTPVAFADEAEAALSPLGVTVRKLGPVELKAIGAGGILAVAAGSDNEPRLTIAEWRGAPDREGWDVVLVGKGLTFDAGGLNLKARPHINKMKFDMAGGAAVIGALERLALQKVNANVVAVVPMTENNIDGKAYRPGDVIKSLDGMTIEVLDTDAEGRIVLADGITYAIREYDPAHIIDVATLTGAMFAVLHEDFAGLMTSDDQLADSLINAGKITNEPLWRLPLVASMDYLVESSVADVSNYGPPGWFGMGSGSPIAGAKFLEKFARGRSWAHIDIAGMAWASRRSARCGPGASGFGVALLDHWVESIAQGIGSATISGPESTLGESW